MSLADDLHGRIKAYADTDEGAAPTLWTPEWVQLRLVAAFRTLRDTPLSFGEPERVGASWPEILMELGDEVEDARPPRRSPPAQAIALAEEALRWAARFLVAKPLCADSLQLWAVCRARAGDDDDEEEGVRAALRARCRKAIKAIDLRDRLNHRERREARRRAAREVLDSSLGESYETLVNRLRLAIADRRLDLALPKVRRQDVYPGKVFSRSRLDAWRKEGAAIVAARLNDLREAVR